MCEEKGFSPSILNPPSIAPLSAIVLGRDREKWLTIRKDSVQRERSVSIVLRNPR